MCRRAWSPQGKFFVSSFGWNYFVGMFVVLTRLKVGGRLIDAKGVSQLYRTRISGWWLLFLALAGTFALAMALMSTPGGQTFLGLSGAVWDDIVNFFRSLLGLAPNSPTV